KAAARKKIYSQKARQEGRQEVSHLLRAIAESEAVQARRLFNSLRGQIDISDQYISTIFEKELEEIIEEYSECLRDAQQEENKAMIQALSQLQAAERRIMSFYSKEKKGVKVKKKQKYFLCKFCGYLHIDKPPESCPICGAQKKDFRETP
ncbi:MAG: rubredoxin-like domain-containing protein, partial [Thermodesulfobacteriota bacterium]